jgi:nicotinamidase-related amidase
MAANLGFTVTIVADATATFDRVGPDRQRFVADQVHRTELASLHGEFATVRTSPELLDPNPAPGAA